MKRITSAIVTFIFALCLFAATAATASAAGVNKVANFKATATPTTVTLTWTKSADATGYLVQQKVNGEWKTIKTIKKAKTTKLKVKKLKAKKTYRFRICAVNKKKKSGFASLKVKTGTAKVNGLVAESVSLNSAKLTWDKVEGATGYEVQRQVSGKWKTVKTLKKQTSVTITNMPAAATSSFRVRAYTTVMAKKHYGKYSAVASVTTAMPAMGKVTVETTATNSATIFWGRVAGANGYQIQKSVSGKWVDVNTKVANNVLKYIVNGLPACENVQLRVRAYQVSGGKTYYTGYSTVTATTKLGTASNLSYSNLTASSVKLTWTSAAGAKGYYVQNNGKTIATVTTNSATVSLSAGTTYNLTVVPYSGSVTGSASNSISFTSAPGKVTGLKASVSDSSFTASWTKVNGASSYQLQYSKDGSAWTTVSTTSTSAGIINLPSNTSYKLRVRAVNKNGTTTQYGEYSDTVTAVTSGCSSVAVNESTAKISWKAVSGAAKYVVQYYDTGSDTWEDRATVTGSTSYSDANLSVEKAALYRVVAYNSSGSAIYTSEGFTATTTGFTVNQDNYKVTLSWPAVSGAGSYKVVRSTQTNLRDIDELVSTTCSLTAYIAPGLIHEYEIYSVTDSAQSLVASFAVEAPEINLGDSTDSSKNAQLLYLVEAINRSKFDYSHNTTVEASSNITHSINSLSIGSSNDAVNGTLLIGSAALSGTGCSYDDGFLTWSTASDVEKLCTYINDSATTEEEKMYQTETVTDNVVISFDKNYARGVANDGTYHYLYDVIEPGENGDVTAKLYNSDSPSAWKNGFSSVTTTKTSTGYKIVAVLKKETTPNYHDGFISTVYSTANSVSNDMKVNSSVIGDTTITAEIDSECRLLSYVIDSPFENSLGVETVISEGSELAIIMNMDMSGTTHYEYKFTRTD